MVGLFKGVERGEQYIKATLAKDTAKTTDDSYVEIYRATS
jgi:hypothetical protein